MVIECDFDVNIMVHNFQYIGIKNFPFYDNIQLILWHLGTKKTGFNLIVVHFYIR